MTTDRLAGELGIDECIVYSLPLRTRFRNTTRREGVLLRGPAGWGDFCPFPEYGVTEAASWLACALESCHVGWPEPIRSRIPINSTIPAIAAEAAHALTLEFACKTAKVKVGEPSQTLADDIARVEAVRDALGPEGAIRVDVNGAWNVEEAVGAIRALDSAANGLEYVEQPCASIAEMAQLRRRSANVPIAADESIRHAEDPLRVAVAEAADIAVIKCTPLGGVRTALKVAESCGLPCVVSSALETSVGVACQLALAGNLPTLDFACGLGTTKLFEKDVVRKSLQPDDGFLPVLSQPPTPDLDLLEEARITDQERVDWWHERLSQTWAHYSQNSPNFDSNYSLSSASVRTQS